MRKFFCLVVCVMTAFAGLATPARCLLVVNNRCSQVKNLPLHAVSATLQASLAGDLFTLVEPQTALGEVVVADSARTLAQKFDCDYVLTATVQEFGDESIGVPVVGSRLKARLALNLAKAATGETVCGVMSRDYSRNYTIEQVKADPVPLFEELLHKTTEDISAKFLAKAQAIGISPVAHETCSVFFGCNVLGADIQIDGTSYGTLPAEVKVTPGIHRIAVSYPPYYIPFAPREAKLFDGQTFAVALQLTEEGRLLKEADRKAENEQRGIDDTRHERSALFKKQLVLADAMLERYNKSGKVDDYVRKTIADGTSLYWKNSFGRIVITEGSAEKIGFATPSTDSADLIYPPDPTEISDGIGKLLKKGAK